MKKLVLATIFALIGLGISTDVSARGNCGYNNCGKNACATSCEKACVPACCKYKVIDEKCECAPICERFVRVTEPAICIRSCRWVCPEGTEMTGERAQGKFELVGGQNQHGY